MGLLQAAAGLVAEVSLEEDADPDADPAGTSGGSAPRAQLRPRPQELLSDWYLCKYHDNYGHTNHYSYDKHNYDDYYHYSHSDRDCD